MAPLLPPGSPSVSAHSWRSINVDFMLKEDEAVGIVGPNGAGKTSLLNLLAGAYRPSAGTVVFCGRNITDSTLPIDAA